MLPNPQKRATAALTLPKTQQARTAVRSTDLLDILEIPKHAIISREEADKRQREAKHHTIVREGEYAAHYVHDPQTGVTTLVREAKIPLSNDQAHA